MQLVLVLTALVPCCVWITALSPEGMLHKAIAPRRPSHDTRPNLILITIDALRSDYVGVYGRRPSLTPSLDAFANEATVYHAAYATAPWTLPSFASLFTLLSPSQCGVKKPAKQGEMWYWNQARLTDSIPLVPELLQHAGYVTAAELCNPFLSEHRGWSRGFEYFHHQPLPEGLDQDMTRGDVITQAASAWIDRNRREPFFLWMHYLDPHAPYDAPSTPSALRKSFPEWRAGDPNAWKVYQLTMSPQEQKDYQVYCRAMYAEEVRYADRMVGELLQAIRASGLWDHSLIIITADHGEELFDHAGLDHGHSLHQEVLSVPLLVKWPAGVTADRQVHQLVALYRVGATLLECAQVTAPPNATAFPLPRREGTNAEAIYSEAPLYGAEQTSLTTDEWRIIYHPTTTRWEVYNRRHDPREQQNLAETGDITDLQHQLQRLTETAAAVTARPSKPSPSLLDAKTARQLRSLGYMK